MKYKPELRNGQRGIFRLEDVSVKEFVAWDIDVAGRDGQPCEIVCFAVANAADGDKPDKGFEYYDIRFDDGVVLHAISGYHFEEIS